MKIVKGNPARTRHLETKLRWFDGPLVKAQDRSDGLNRHMFDEDFPNIFHYSNRRSENLFNIDANNEKLAHRMLDNLETRSGPGPMDNTLREFVEGVAQSLVWYGKAFYYLHDNDDKKETNIISYSYENLYSIAGCVVQYLPKRIERNWDREDVELPRELRLLNSEKTLCFRWPAAMRRKVSAQNRVLASLDKHDRATALRFQPQVTHENPNPRNNFDFRHWSEIHDLSLFRATRATGWGARKFDSQKKSDFFVCHRLIRFRRNQINLRDHILTQLGDELTRVGKNYWKFFEIKISATNALPSVSELNDLEARLSCEEAGFSDVLDYCYKS